MRDRLAAYQLDAAVTLLGTIVENALQEREERGSGKEKKWVAKYRLSDILEDDFKFPPPGQMGDVNILDNTVD